VVSGVSYLIQVGIRKLARLGREVTRVGCRSLIVVLSLLGYPTCFDVVLCTSGSQPPTTCTNVGIT
jgi:hypothetical protein